MGISVGYPHTNSVDVFFVVSGLFPTCLESDLHGLLHTIGGFSSESCKMNNPSNSRLFLTLELFALSK